MTTVVSIENLSKSYRLGVISTGTFYGDLKRWWARRQGREDPYQRIGGIDYGNREGETVWALSDVSFSVQQGRAVGIIGRNGAGKSTVLKILSRVTAPTSGVVKVKGRIASLLEVGTGFHPELTGRENIYLNGAIMGMRRSEVNRKFDEIVDFSGVEKYIDTPVKRYSSGMYVRLAFAVSAHLEPEILIVDEVLAVGDAEFQRKCLGKMGDVASSGRTVLFVSHNMSAINSFCEDGIVLDKGQVSFMGNAGDAVRHYLEHAISGGDTAESERGFVSFPDDPLKPIQIKKVFLTGNADEVKNVFDFQDNPFVNISFDLRVPDQGYYAALVVIDLYGNWVYFSADDDLAPSKLAYLQPGEYSYKIRLPEKLLKPGKYYLTVSLTGKNGQGPYDRYDHILTFTVIDQFSRRGEKQGFRKTAVVAPEIEWDLQD